MNKIFSFFTSHKNLMTILIIIVVVVTAIISRIPDWKKKQEQQTETLRNVSLISVVDYMKNRGQINANGTVESLEQAELKSQVSAPVTRIYTQIGQKVRAGQVLVSLQNNDLTAQYNQAMAGVKSQRARLEELKKGTRTEDLRLSEIQVENAKQALADTIAQQDTSVSNAYTNLLNAGISALPAKGNLAGGSPIISGSYTGKNEGQLEITIYSAGGLNFQIKGLEFVSGLVSTSPTPIGNSGLYIQFTDTDVPLSNSWTVMIPNKQSAAYTVANNAYLAALENKNSAINNAKNALKSAEQTLAIKQAGASNEQIRSQEAVIEQALASAAVISAQISKTVIRSPISGTVSALPVKYGELVSPGQLIASVVNQGGLQIKAYISDYDLAYVKEEQVVDINESIKGTITNISPSVDPSTKNVQIQIAVNEPDKSGLVVGQSVAIKINNQLEANSLTTIYQLPLQAIKIDGQKYSVLTLNSNNEIEEKPIEVGGIFGENVEVINGLTPDLKIVSPVYELKVGQKVNVNQ